ncbi:MAG: type II toxin-antitoxin system Phd/YefM family antitoxin [Burkholderiales bacterium]
MERATISELKNRLSAYLKKVRAGETVLILDRDQPVARLERVVAEERGQDRLTRLERSGLLRRATRPLAVKTLRGTAPKPKQSVVQALLEERNESR